MQFEVQVPQPHHPGEFRKLVIEAPNWLLALRNGLKQVGDDNNVRNITCDIMDDEQIRVTDTKTGRIYEVRPAPKHQISPSSQPVAEAAAIVSAAALGGQTLAFDSPVFDFPIPSASSPDTLAARAEEVEPVVAPSATSRSAIENAQTITDDGSLQSALQARLAQQAPPPPSTTPEPEVPVFSAPLPPIDALSATPAIPPTTPSPALTAPKPPAEMTAVSMSDLAPQPPPAQPAASAFSSPPPAQPAAPAFSAPPPAQPVASAFSAPPPAQPVASAFSSPPPAQPVAPAFSAPPPAQPAAPAFSSPPPTPVKPAAQPAASAFSSPPPAQPAPAKPTAQPAPAPAKSPARGASQSLSLSDSEGKYKPGMTTEILADAFMRAMEIYDHGEDRHAAMQFVLDLSMSNVNAAGGAVLLTDINSPHQELWFEVSAGERADELLNFRIPMGQGIAGFCAKEGINQVLANAQQDPRFQNDILNNIGIVPGSMLCAAVQHQKRVLGAIQLYNNPGDRPFTQGELSIVAYLAHVAGEYLISLV